MIANGTSSLVLWAVNASLALVVAVGGFSLSREYERNDEQERRITAGELSNARIETKLNYIAAGIEELKSEVRRSRP